MSGIVHVAILLSDKESTFVVQGRSMAAHYRDIATSSGTAVRLHLGSRSINANVPSPGKLILFVFTVLVSNARRGTEM